MSESWPELVNQQETGDLSVKKSSTRPELTDENSIYSFEDAEFGIYEKEEFSAEPKAVLKTGASGETNTVTLPAGIYYVKERKAPAGYRLSQEVKKVVLTKGQHQQVILKTNRSTSLLRQPYKKRSKEELIFQGKEQNLLCVIMAERSCFVPGF
ncbi:MAG: prealbumin-like fold domain-containing protein [Blautia sp.]